MIILFEMMVACLSLMITNLLFMAILIFFVTKLYFRFNQMISLLEKSIQREKKSKEDTENLETKVKMEYDIAIENPDAVFKAKRINVDDSPF
jgi:cell division protein FtsL